MKCCFCGKEIKEPHTNNPWPVNQEEDARCCNECNINIVIPARCKEIQENSDSENEQGTTIRLTIGEARRMELKAAIEKRLRADDLFLETNGESCTIKDLDGFAIGEFDSLAAVYTWLRDGGLERLEDERPELEL